MFRIRVRVTCRIWISRPVRLLQGCSDWVIYPSRGQGSSFVNGGKRTRQGLSFHGLRFMAQSIDIPDNEMQLILKRKSYYLRIMCTPLGKIAPYLLLIFSKLLVCFSIKFYILKSRINNLSLYRFQATQVQSTHHLLMMLVLLADDFTERL